jgi:hypothetical protein
VPASKPASTPPEKLYTQAEFDAGIQTSAETAVDVAVPLAVQAAVAQKEGEKAVLQVRLDWTGSALGIMTDRATAAEKRARMLEDGMIWGAVGAAVFTAGAFIFGAWAGMTLGR